jgi:uridine phosphorylase
MIMEELIVGGVRTFLGLEWAGSLHEYAPIGSLIIPTFYTGEEGTLFHCVDADIPIAAHGELVELLERAAQAQGLDVVKGPQWTIDAPHREFKNGVARCHSEGVVVVDMETSAMYALGRLRRVSVCNLLMVSDVLGNEWRAAFWTERLRRAKRSAEQLVLECLASGIVARCSCR